MIIYTLISIDVVRTSKGFHSAQRGLFDSHSFNAHNRTSVVKPKLARKDFMLRPNDEIYYCFRHN